MGEDYILTEKYRSLCQYLQSLGSVAVAFSGGVDSALLLRAAADTLGKNAIAVTIVSQLSPQRETSEAAEFCSQNGIKQIVIDFDALSVPEIVNNPPNRCYHCKKAIFERIIGVARVNDIINVCDGSNVDDVGDYRPGMKALAELGIISPLRECGINKEEIRKLSKKLGLPTWDKPSAACLASRIPYNEQINQKKLFMIDMAEQIIYNLGIIGSRVRLHGENLARIECDVQRYSEIILTNRELINDELHKLGFAYITLDLRGYRTGSLNEVIV
ncbi:MAG: ATP-dependent sacrificial sulfur transferase LarE [Spirochaetales bacterium]|nr:ATP-dependent sacrificial sulfur transferase LarE [Spirochaetales bacterium]